MFFILFISTTIRKYMYYSFQIDLHLIATAFRAPKQEMGGIDGKTNFTQKRWGSLLEWGHAKEMIRETKHSCTQLYHWIINLSYKQTAYRQRLGQSRAT